MNKKIFLSIGIVTCLNIGVAFCLTDTIIKDIWSPVTYNFAKDSIDVIIPCIKKDQRTLDLCIEGIRKNGNNIRRIIVISPEKLTAKAEWFDEAKFPFSKDDIFAEIPKKPHHIFRKTGWIFQQLLKFYAPFVIPNISSNILSVDADTVFLNPTDFYDEASGAGFFNTRSKMFRPYFEHAKRFLPGFKKYKNNISGITHHMLFQRPILQDLFIIVESVFKKDFWKSFCSCIDATAPYHFASEFEIYFNFTMCRTIQCSIRNLKWTNVNFEECDFEKFKNNGYHYVSCHTYLNNKKSKINHKHLIKYHTSNK